MVPPTMPTFTDERESFHCTIKNYKGHKLDTIIGFPKHPMI